VILQLTPTRARSLAAAVAQEESAALAEALTRCPPSSGCLSDADRRRLGVEEIARSAASVSRRQERLRYARSKLREALKDSRNERPPNKRRPRREYRRASARDGSGPSESVRARLLRHAAELAAKRGRASSRHEDRFEQPPRMTRAGGRGLRPASPPRPRGSAGGSPFQCALLAAAASQPPSSRQPASPPSLRPPPRPVRAEQAALRRCPRAERPPSA